MADRLLPPGSSPLENTLEQAQGGIDAVPVPLSTLFDPARCPAGLLPWLAWAVSVDVWDATWSERTKRQVIAQSVEVHRRKGSVGSVKRAIQAAGFDNPTIIERLHRRTYNGEIAYDGRFFHGWEKAWGFYRVILDRPIRNDKAAIVRAILASTAPARSHLLTLDFQIVPNLYDGRSSYDGAYNYGIA